MGHKIPHAHNSTHKMLGFCIIKGWCITHSLGQTPEYLKDYTVKKRYKEYTFLYKMVQEIEKY